MSVLKRNGLLNPQLFDDFLTRELANWGMNQHSNTNTTIPAVNICETGENYEVEVAAPGLNKEDFRVELDGNKLTISCDRQAEERTEEHRYTRKEFSYQSFQRMFQLPKDVVDADKIQAKYENGLLRLLIPKREEAKQRPPRMIHIA